MTEPELSNYDILFLIAATALTTKRRDPRILAVALSLLFEQRGVPHRIRGRDIQQLVIEGRNY